MGLCGAQAEDTCVFSQAVPSRLFFQCPGEGGRGDAPRDGRLPHLRVAERRLAGHHLDRLVPLDKCARVVPQEPSARRHGGNLWDPFLHSKTIKNGAKAVKGETSKKQRMKSTFYLVNNTIQEAKLQYYPVNNTTQNPIFCDFHWKSTFYLVKNQIQKV